MNEELSGGQVIARQLALAGIDTCFGIVAGPMIPAMYALRREGIRFIGCRHEEQAVFMAQAWGYLTGRPGVVMTGSGPGTTNTVTGLLAAQANGWPVVVLGGSGLARERGLGSFQETDQVRALAPFCKWAVEVDSVERIPQYLHLALGKAVSGRPGPVYLDFPGELPGQRVAAEAVRFVHQAPRVTRPQPDAAAIEETARLLAEAERPLVLIGKGAAWAGAGPALERLVGLGLPFLASPMGRGVVPDDDPRNVGSARSLALRQADVVLMMGGRFNWIFHYGRPPRFAEGVRIVQVDVVAEELYSGAPVELGLVADCAAAAEALYEALRGRRLRCQDTGWLEGLRREAERGQAQIEELLRSDARPVSPYRLWGEVRDVLPREATVVMEGEVIMAVGRQMQPAYRPKQILNAGTSACMGTGVPYAIGAKLARPEGPVVAVLGDSAFGFSAMEVETAARVGAPVVFVISNNQGVTGNRGRTQAPAWPQLPEASALLPARYEMMAEMVGGYGVCVEEPERIRPALEAALASGRLAIVNVMTDPSFRSPLAERAGPSMMY